MNLVLNSPSNIPKNSFFSYLLFWWVLPLLKIANRRVLQQEDIISVKEKDSSKWNFELFLKQYKITNSKKQSSLPVQTTFFAIYKSKIIFDHPFAFTFFPTLEQILLVGLLYFVEVASTLINLAFFKDIVQDISLENRGESIVPLIPGFSLMILYYLIKSFVRSNYLFQNSILTIRMTGALNNIIFQKVIKLAALRNQQYKIGDILNMIQVDVLQIIAFTQNFISLLSFLPLLILAILEVQSTIQNSSIVILMVVFSFIFISIAALFGKLYGHLQNQFMDKKDKRMRSLDELMKGIKSIKYNMFESFFEKRVGQKRKEEVSKLGFLNLLTILNSSIMASSDSLIILLVTYIFGIYSFSEFLLIRSSFSIIIGFISIIPTSIQGYVVGKSSLVRLNEFLNGNLVYQRELLPIINNPDIVIQLNNAQFHWNKLPEQGHEPLIQFSTEIINIEIKKGEFVLFFGPLGSGKSSIFQGVLGESEVIGGQEKFRDMVKINGILSICTQEPWIKQASFKENIIFGDEEYDEDRYQQTLVSSCLNEDLNYLVDSDETEIGEKGDTLSGGQKKRINFARSIYKKADIYMFDDPLSALDVPVARHIADNCFSHFLVDKTRIVFSSTLVGMEQADRVFVLSEGRIINETSMKLLLQGSCENEQKMDKKIYQKSEALKIPLFKNSEKKQLIEKEQSYSGSISVETYKSLFWQLGGYTFMIIAFLGVGALLWFILYGRILMKDVKTVKNPTEQEMTEQKEMILLYCAFDLLRIICSLLVQSSVVISMLKVSKKIHSAIVKILLQASFTKFYNKITTGRLMNRLSKDIYEVDQLLPSDISSILVSVSSIIAMSVVVIILFNIRVIPIVFIFLFISLALCNYFIKAKIQIVRIEAQSKSPILQYVQEVFHGIIYIRNCLNTQIISEEFQKLIDIDLKNQIALNGIQFLFECLANFLNMWPLLLSYSVLYFDTDVSSKDAMVIVLAITNISQGLIDASKCWISFQTHMANVERCNKIIRETICEDYSDKKDHNDTFNSIIDRNFSQNNQKLSDTLSISESYISEDSVCENCITFKNASFQYQEGHPSCLNNISVSFLGNQKIGIVGRTGAGKSSISLALLNMLDLVTGSVQIGNKDIKEFTLKELRTKISVVSQEPFIFEGTLLENLDPYSIYTREQIENIVEQCQFNSISSFKEGLETKITSVGGNLSEGEKQIISICRSLLKQSKILIFDEPTGKVDENMEQIITKLIHEHLKDCLIITIAHRIKTILGCDKILVLEHGTVKEFDSVDKLKNNPTTSFHKIFKVQLNKEQKIN